MFMKLKLSQELRRMCKAEGCCEETIFIIERGMSKHMSAIEANGFNTVQGVLFLVSNTIVNGRATGALALVKSQYPEVYEDLKRLWQMCGRLVRASDLFAAAVVVGDDGNPFR